MTESESRGGWKRQGFIPVSRRSTEQPPPPPAPAQAQAQAQPPRAGQLPPAPAPYSVPPPPGYGLPPGPGPAPDARAEPEFTRLWERWTAEGRTVPGRPDPEWTALTHRDPWPR